MRLIIEDTVEQRTLLAYNLQFFAKDEGGEKTEEATPKKLNDARNEGQAPRSQDLNTASMLLVLIIGLKIFGSFIYDRIYETYYYYMTNMSEYATNEFTLGRSMNLFHFGMREVLFTILPISLIGVLVAFVVGVKQVKWKITLKPLKPKPSKLNPIKGMKRLFSKDKLVELIKALVKLGVLFWVVFSYIQDQWGLITNIYQLEPVAAVHLIIDTVLDIALRIALVFLVIAFADWYYQKRKFRKDMKMTKQEVKDEYKNSEGNPEIKSAIRRKMMEASRRRMMQALPEADVVITNPTHLAVALKYDKDTAEAPIVVAKGADFLAEKIKEIARENHIEIVENKPVARMLYHNVDIGSEIPPELYQMVAEILAYVYSLDQAG
ncbi:MAG: flagellar biosynthesis protein FlhB [Eubacterium sp.]|nr:flagellar biosynthesis protein FlhB [Eubacterium sp.]